jgi:hypothetical protein
MKESVKSFLKDVFHGEKHPKHRLGKMSDKETGDSQRRSVDRLNYRGLAGREEGRWHRNGSPGRVIGPLQDAMRSLGARGKRRQNSHP